MEPASLPAWAGERTRGEEGIGRDDGEDTRGRGRYGCGWIISLLLVPRSWDIAQMLSSWLCRATAGQTSGISRARQLYPVRSFSTRQCKVVHTRWIGVERYAPSHPPSVSGCLSVRSRYARYSKPDSTGNCRHPYPFSVCSYAAIHLAGERKNGKRKRKERNRKKEKRRKKERKRKRKTKTKKIELWINTE